MLLGELEAHGLINEKLVAIPIDRQAGLDCCDVSLK